jgi:tripartite-type tricarboxylate transporter receptor subunit TctC
VVKTLVSTLRTAPVGLREVHRLCCTLIFIGVSAATAITANAQSYPAKPVRIVISASPGGNLDLIARATAQKLFESLGKPFLVESRAGGSGIIAHETVAKSAPDGYTLLVVPAGAHTINPGLFRKLPYDTVRDFTPISIIARGPLLLVAHPSLNVSSLKALIALARAKPGQIVAANGGRGTAGHLALELLMVRAGVRFLQVPYKGNAPGLVDTVAGHTQIMVDTPSTSIPLVRAGKLKGLGVTSLERSPLLPDVPSIAESGYPGYEASVFIVLAGPAGLPRDIANRLYTETASMARNPETRQRFAEQGVDMVGSTPEEMRDFVVKDIAKWQKVIREAGIKLE